MRFAVYAMLYWDRFTRQIARLPVALQIPIWIAIVITFLVIAAIFFIPILIYRLLLGLKFRLFPPRATRDISRLGVDDEGLDVVSEAIADEGTPLKEHHRRLICRDRRLLPKPKPPANVWPRPRRKTQMDADEADRLFTATMRTRNRKIRDLTADEEQLNRYGLPCWNSERDVAEALEISVKQLRHYAIHRDAEPVCHYVTFAIPKRNGGRRLILAPKSKLKAIQRRLLRQLVDKLPVSDCAHGFRTGRSIRTGADPHVGKAAVLKMDLQDFFPSVTFGRVRGFLIALGYGYQAATTLATLMTEAERQPVRIDEKTAYVPVGWRHCVQGAPTSPGICNAICHRLDRRLEGLARKYGCAYTRYADDLTFSGPSIDDLKTVRRLTERICEDEGFRVHPEKTRILRRGRKQTVTGVTVNDVAGLSRKERRKLRAAIHRLVEQSSQRTPTMSLQQIRGRIAYLNMLNPRQAETLRRQLEREF